MAFQNRSRRQAMALPLLDKSADFIADSTLLQRAERG
jgi:hypothetical protein